jgi:hypothetical protein
LKAKRHVCTVIVHSAAVLLRIIDAPPPMYCFDEHST